MIPAIPRRSLLAFVLFGSILVGCRGEGPKPPTWERLIEPESSELFDLGRSLVEEREVRFWDFKQSDVPGHWSTPDMKQGSVTPRGLHLKTAGAAPRIELDVDFGADEINLIDIDVGPSATAIDYLSWVTEDGAASSPRIDPLRVGQPHMFHRFDATGHPAWKGRIRSLRIHMAETVFQLHLAYVRASQRTQSDERLTAALARPWKIDLGREVRNARLAPPDLPLEFPLTGSPGARILSFAFGTQPGVRSAVEFQIFLESAAGRSKLFHDEVQDGDTWHTGELEFQVPEDPAKLVFLTQSVASFDLRRGLPAWASLRVDLPEPAEELPPNIILVSMDTLRADHMSIYGYPRETTPHIAAWAESRAIVFDMAIAPSPWTLPSHASIFSGLDALHHGINIEESVPPHLQLFTEDLQAAGYTTFALTGGGYLAPQYGFTRGFDIYHYWMESEGEIEAGTANLIDTLEHLPRPFFVFFHTYEVHSPYRARSPYFERFFSTAETTAKTQPIVERSSPMKPAGAYRGKHWFARASDEGPGEPLEKSELPELVARYDSTIAYMDEHLGQFFEALETSPDLRDDTAVILVSDHGEALGEKGLGGHASLYDFILRVPLILSLPGGERGGTKISQQVRLIDLAPTVLDLVGVADRPESDGTSLLPLVEGDEEDFPREAWSYAASSNYGLALRVANRMKYIFTNTIWPSPEDREELYDLDVDSDESHNIASTSTSLEGFRQRAKEHLEAGAQGLAITLANPGNGVLSGSMHSNAFLISTVKTWDELYSSMEWSNRTLTYRIPPGSEFEFLVTDIPHREPIHMEGQYRLAGQDDLESQDDGVRRFTKALIPHDFSDQSAIALFPEGWQETDGPVDGKPLASLRFSWRGSPDSEGLEVDVPPELLEQLRGLGYVD